MDIEEKIEAVEEKIEDRSLAMEILQQLKRTITWLLAIILILIGVIVGQYCLYTYERLQWDYSSTTIDAQQDGEGVNIVGGGDVNYGAESEDNSQKENQ